MSVGRAELSGVGEHADAELAELAVLLRERKTAVDLLQRYYAVDDEIPPLDQSHIDVQSVVGLAPAMSHLLGKNVLVARVP